MFRSQSSLQQLSARISIQSVSVDLTALARDVGDSLVIWLQGSLGKDARVTYKVENTRKGVKLIVHQESRAKETFGNPMAGMAVFIPAQQSKKGTPGFELVLEKAISDASKRHLEAIVSKIIKDVVKT